MVDTFKDIETPFYYYDLDVLKDTLDYAKSEGDKHNFHIHYALKANTNNEILKIIKEKGLGADCVSGNEVLKAIEVGFSPNSIAFAGVGKTDREINIGLDNDIFCFNCESIQEIEVISQLAKTKNKVANIALRINPNVNANTHKYITTGLEENKFGINIWELDFIVERLKELESVKLIGIHFHIGSQINNLMPFKNLCNRVNELNKWFKDRSIHLSHINVGGGLGIDYVDPENNKIPNFKDFFNVFKDFLDIDKNQNIHFELGRSLVGNCGALICKVLYVKKGVKTNFAIVDAGMTELIRPALYQAVHKIENLSNKDSYKEFYDVVGPICESSDCFGKKIELPITRRGDLIKIHSTGAYGEVMASQYNLRELPKAIYN